ncbi:MAG: extracellular solute-binding protein [Oscillospiraceae bacterium]|jgi:putative aldouronate transport system substrate-binding protein|nr:extracellular solute-binding protein [Oscillospiraceae bacterium]
MRRILSLALCAMVCFALIPAGLAGEDAPYRYDSPITLKVAVFDRGVTGQTPVDDNWWTDWIQKEFGDPRKINLKFIQIPRSEEIDKLNVLMASGDAADIHFTYTESVITNFVQQGGVVELTDLIDQYGQGLKAYLGEDLLKFGIFEGGQYAVPAKRVVLATQGFFLRKDWLDKLGLPEPTTKEEFYNTLVAFRDSNPGGVEGLVPYAFNYDLTTHNHLMLSFISSLDEKTLATVPDIMWEGYDDYVLFLNKLYNEGLVSTDFALDNNETHTKAVAAGQAGGYTYNYDHPIRVSPGILGALNAFEPEADLVSINAFESVTDPTKYYHAMYAPNGIFNFVPMYAKNPEASVMYLDWISDLDTLYFLQNGEEGRHHELDEAGVPILLDVTDETKFNSMQNIDYTLLTNGQEFSDPSLRIKAQSYSYQNYADKFEAMYDVANIDPLVTNFHFDVILAADAQYNTSLTAFRRELLTKATMAKPEDCLETFHQLREQYMRDGGQAVMEEKIAAWDNMHK